MTYVPAEDRYEHMRYRRSGRSGLLLPALSLGLWNNFGHDHPLENSRAIVRRAFDLGITHFDLANNYGPPYGSAEENFGRLMQADLAPYRDELVISTKAGYDMWPGPYGEWGSRKYLLASLDQSLERMGLEYVDIFYSHRFDPETPLEETMGALDAAVRQGKALYVGISSYSAAKTGTPRALQINIGVYSQTIRWGYGVDPPSDTNHLPISPGCGRAAGVGDRARVGAVHGGGNLTCRCDQGCDLVTVQTAPLSMRVLYRTIFALASVIAARAARAAGPSPGASWLAMIRSMVRSGGRGRTGRASRGPGCRSRGACAGRARGPRPASTARPG